MNGRLEKALRAEMEDGEVLRWSGRPSGRRFLLWMLPLAGVGAACTGVTLFWVSLARPGWEVMCLSGAITATGFILAALPGLALATASRTLYAVTDRRLIIIQQLGWESVSSYRAEDLPYVRRVDRADGTGDLWLMGESPWSWRLLRGLADARTAERLLRNLQSQAGPGAGKR